MSDIEVNSEDDGVNSYSSVIERTIINSVIESSDISESEKAIDTTMCNISVGHVVSEENEWRLNRVNSNINRHGTVQCKKTLNSFSMPSTFSSYGQDTQLTSRPISLSILKNTKDFSRLRVLSGKPSEEMESSVPDNLVSERGKLTDKDRAWNLKKATLNNQKHTHLMENGLLSVRPSNSDDVKSNRKLVLYLETVGHRGNQREQNVFGSKLSLPTPNHPSRKSRLSSSKIVRLSKERESLTLISDRSVQLGDIQIENITHEDEGEKTDESEVWSTKQNEGCGMGLIQPNAETEGSSRMCITRKTDKVRRKKLTKSVVRTFDLMQVTRTDVLPPNEYKTTPADDYARSITDISDQLEHNIPEKAWLASSSGHFGRKSRQGEESVPKSDSSIVPRVNPSTADIFGSVLVNEISKEHSYLKPCNNRGRSRNWKSYRLPQWDGTRSLPFDSTEYRYVHPFEAEETNRPPVIKKPPESKSWFSSIFSNISLSTYL